MARDVFRPHNPVAQIIYDAFQDAADRRGGKSPEEWMATEAEAVWKAAAGVSSAVGLPVLTIEQIREASNEALGHIDYGAKWTYAVLRLMRAGKEEG